MSSLCLRSADDHREQVSQRIHGDMDLRAVGSLVAVVTGSVPTFGRAAEHAAVQHRSCRLLVAAFEDAFKQPQLVGDLLEDTGLMPAPGLLVDRVPRRKVAGQIPPRAASPHDVPDPVEQIPHRVLPLRSVLSHQRQKRS